MTASKQVDLSELEARLGGVVPTAYRALGAPFGYEFDGAAAVSRRLLALARSAIGGNP